MRPKICLSPYSTLCYKKMAMAELGLEKLYQNVPKRSNVSDYACASITLDPCSDANVKFKFEINISNIHGSRACDIDIHIKAIKWLCPAYIQLM